MSGHVVWPNPGRLNYVMSEEFLALRSGGSFVVLLYTDEIHRNIRVILLLDVM